MHVLSEMIRTPQVQQRVLLRTKNRALT